MKRWSEEELRTFNKHQIEEIHKFKWIESEKAGYDIGELKASITWISLYGEKFRKFYISSHKEKNLI